ncbi:Clr5 domain-containing protein [Xylariales sp. PMI_506]|nr:Clr5 domain-containing protein [Xylariales sp. PMI_506]
MDSDAARVKLSLHTHEEWDKVRPIIEKLYLQEHKPLSSVARTLERYYQFRASPSMYKRRLRAWGIYKNNCKGRNTLKPDEHGCIKPTRYLAQNDADESMHTLLDLLAPWVYQTWYLSEYNLRVDQALCPPSAKYVYDEFTRNIAAAVVAYESGNATWGALVRRAFLDLEYTLDPRGRSVYTLKSLFFALGALVQAGMYQVCRQLVSHAKALVMFCTIPAGDKVSVSGVSKTKVPDMGGHISHPLPQILDRFQRVTANLDDTMLANAVSLAWLVFHRTVISIKTKLIASQAYEPCFWRGVVRNTRDVNSFAPNEMIRWAERRQSISFCQSQLLKHTDVDTDLNLLHLDNIVALDAFANHETVKEKALELLQRVRRRYNHNSTDEQLAQLQQLAYNAHLELASHYRDNGDVEGLVKHFDAIMPPGMNIEWKSILTEEFNLRHKAITNFQRMNCVY